MKFKKLFLYFALLLLLSVSFFACGNEIDIPDYTADPDPIPDSEIPDRVINMVKYKPTNYDVWDSWCIAKGDSIHLFHLQGPINGLTYPKPVNLRGFGHATSGDLLHWSEKNEVLALYDKKLDNDWDFRFTGCTVERQGKYYTFYTMRKWAGQRIGVAISDNLYDWKEYEGNPVIVPDKRWFITFKEDGSGSNNDIWKETVDCRDMVVVKDKAGSGYYGYFVSSSDIKGLTTPTSVVGIAYSNDLLKWEQRGIAYYPTGVSMPEMIDVFEYNGTWYMTLTTAKNNGSLNAFSDKYIARGTIYAKADSPTGPFIEDLSDNVLIGGQINSGYSMRTIDYSGKTRLMYVDVDNGSSVLSLPKDIGLNNKGQLRAYYSSDLLTNLRVFESEPTIYAQPNNSFGWPTHGGIWHNENGMFTCKTDSDSWQAAIFNRSSKNMELTFTVKKSTCDSYGIVFSDNTANVTLSNLAHILVIEPQKNRIYLTTHLWDFENCRSYDFEDGVEYKFRTILMGNTIELYINDEFVFNSGLYNAGNYLSGIFANNGNIEICDLVLFKLQE